MWRDDDALVPSLIACFDSSPGRMRRTAVWISRDEMVDFLLYDESLEAWPTSQTPGKEARG